MLLRKKQYPEALKELNRAIELTTEAQKGLLSRSEQKGIDENLAVMHHHRGEVYEAQGKKDEAERDFELAGKLGFNPEEGVY